MQNFFLTQQFILTQKFFFTQNFFYPKFFLTQKIFLTKKCWPKFLDYIFNYKNSLTTNQMGFDTIEINLV